MRTSPSTPEDHIRARLTISAVALEFAQPNIVMTDMGMGGSKRGCPQTCFARQLTMYLLNTIFQITQTRIGELFARDRSTVAHASRIVEESREDPVLDAKIRRLESFLSQAPETHIHKLEAA